MILVTGATGFVGAALVSCLVERGNETRVCLRRKKDNLPSQVQAVVVTSMDGSTNWHVALSGVNMVIHAAARVHVMSEASSNPLVEFRRDNVDGTLNLARQAAAASVRRFVFISSVKVNGEFTPDGAAFSEDDPPSPVDPYGVSKMEAERGLREIALSTGMELVIIRPPLVYGPGVKANFAALAKGVKKGWPLPLGAIHNKRSLVALDNLVDFIVTCLIHPKAANQTFLVSDGQDLSTAELVRGLARWAGKPARLFSIPVWMLVAAGAAFGKRDAVQRLTGNLQVDISKARMMLNWMPPISTDEGLKRVILGAAIQ